MLKKLQISYKSSDKLMFFPILASLMFIFFSALFYFINTDKLPNQLPVFYSLPWGEGQLASRSEFLIILPLSLMITLVNLVIAWHLHDSQQILKRTLAIASSLVSLLISITMVRAILIFI